MPGLSLLEVMSPLAGFSSPWEGGASLSLYLWLLMGSNKILLTHIGEVGVRKERGLERMTEKPDFCSVL